MKKENKKPCKLQGMKFGVEIEYCSNEYALRDSVHAQALNMGLNFNQKFDGSVTPGNNEAVSGILEYSDSAFEQIKRMVELIKQNNGFVNGSCGIHIHVDFRNQKPESLVRLVKEYYSKQALIFDMFRVLESRQRTYTKWIPAEYVNKVKGTQKQTILDSTDGMEWLMAQDYTDITYRYRGLNLSSLAKHTTVEFRIFNGSLNVDKIKSYVQFCLALVKKNCQAKRASKKIKKYNGLTARYDSRTWLLRLGFIGKEFETAREVIRENLPAGGQGFIADTAWRKARYGRGNGTSSPELLPDEDFKARQFD